MELQYTTYTYTPLDATKRQIRLLRLLPVVHRKGPFDRFRKYLPESKRRSREDDVSVIRCTFSLVSLDDQPSYEALSYVWGDPTSDLTIQLEGHATPVTSNLYSALKHLRQTKTERTLWIDALCINQGDNDERSAQVALMQHIYWQASAVVVFFGDSWDGVDTVFELVEVAGTNPALHYDGLIEPSLSMFGICATSPQIKDSLLKFVSLPWWTRLWTVQEYVLAQQIIFQCGHYTVDGTLWKSFLRSWEYHFPCCRSATYVFGDEDGDDELDIIGGLDRARNLELILEQEEDKHYDLLYITSMFKNQQCLHPLDKVYGLLGLAGSFAQASIYPDYTRSPGDVYTDVAMMSLSETRSLDFLSFVYGDIDARGSSRTSLVLPSFIPDLTKVIADHTWASSRLDRCLLMGLYDAAKGSDPDFTLYGSDEATTGALFVDSICHIEIEYGKFEETLDHYNELPYQRGKGTPYDSVNQAFLRTICGDVHMGLDRQWELAGDCVPVSHGTWRDWCSNSVPPAEYEGELLDFQGAFDMVRACRGFALTTKGYMGFVPSNSEEGDVIVLMPGGKVPYVLHPVPEVDNHNKVDSRSNGPRHYRVLGDAYIQGIMHGEAWDVNQLETIVLI